MVRVTLRQAEFVSVSRTCSVQPRCLGSSSLFRAECASGCVLGCNSGRTARVRVDSNVMGSAVISAGVTTSCPRARLRTAHAVGLLGGRTRCWSALLERQKARDRENEEKSRPANQSSRRARPIGDAPLRRWIVAKTGGVFNGWPLRSNSVVAPKDREGKSSKVRVLFGGS
jgi:hypothetical protein